MHEALRVLPTVSTTQSTCRWALVAAGLLCYSRIEAIFHGSPPPHVLLCKALHQLLSPYLKSLNRRQAAIVIDIRYAVVHRGSLAWCSIQYCSIAAVLASGLDRSLVPCISFDKLIIHAPQYWLP